MIVNKSFKYDSDECPKVHKWVTSQSNFSDAIRKLIEKNCEPDPVLKALQEIRQQITGLRLGGPVTPQQEAELIKIEESVNQVEERQEVKEVNREQLKTRYFNL
jgi:hypothetical protein